MEASHCCPQEAVRGTGVTSDEARQGSGPPGDRGEQRPQTASLETTWEASILPPVQPCWSPQVRASGRWAGDRGFYTHRTVRRWPSSI